MLPTWSEVLHKAMHTKRPTIKTWVRVPARYKRDAKGRFVGGVERKAYTRRLLDRKNLKTGMELMAENVAANNALLKRLTGR